MEELLNAYYQVLELAKENAFKCHVCIETYKSKSDSELFFTVWVRKFNEKPDFSQQVPFYTFLPDELQSNVEKVKQLIEKLSC